MGRTATDIRPVSALESARRQLGLTQRGLARRAQVSRNLISQVERGLLPAPATRQCLADALGVPEHELWPSTELPSHDPIAT